MEKKEEEIDKLVFKLKVLDSRIKKLESITEEILRDVEHEYRQQMTALNQKKEEAVHKLLQMRNKNYGAEEDLKARARQVSK